MFIRQLAELMEFRLSESDGAAPPTTTLSSVQGDQFVVGIDLGGTKILGGAAAADKDLVQTKEVLTTRNGYEALQAQLLDMITDLSGGNTIDRIVIGVPAAVVPNTGATAMSPNLDLAGGTVLARTLETHFSCPVALENDVNLAAYGEAELGVSAPVNSLAFLSFGTGVGLGLIFNGQIWRGALGRAGEIGYMPTGHHPFQQAERTIAGLFEDQVGSEAIRRRSAEAGLTAVNNVREIFCQATAGNAEAISLIDDVAKDAAIGLAAIQVLLDPALIVLGGGIGTQPLFADAVKLHASRLLPYDASIEIARLGPEAGMLGALHLAANKHNTSHLEGTPSDTVQIPA